MCEPMAKSDQPTTIKKYANRRLYNTGTSTYVTLEDLATMENVYSPAIGALNEPIALAAQNALANLERG